MLSHSFDRFYVVTKFILPTIKDVKFSLIDLDSKCNYVNVDLDKHRYPVHYLPNIRNFWMKIVPFVYFYKKQIDSYNKTVYDNLMKEIPLIIPNFEKNKKKKRGIITSLVTCFIRLAYEGLSSYLHNKRQTALKKSFIGFIGALMIILILEYLIH